MYIPENTPETQQRFHDNIIVGPYPEKRNPKWDVVFGVTDIFCEHDDYWYPSGEHPIYSQIIFPCMIQLLKEFNAGKKIYLHCTAGINRSVTIRDCFWYFLFQTNYPGYDNGDWERRDTPDTFDRHGMMGNIAFGRLESFTPLLLKDLHELIQENPYDYSRLERFLDTRFGHWKSKNRLN